MQNFADSLAQLLGSLQDRILELSEEALSSLQLEVASLREQLHAAGLKTQQASAFEVVKDGHIDKTLQSEGMGLALSLAVAWSNEQPENADDALDEWLAQSWEQEKIISEITQRNINETSAKLTALELWEILAGRLQEEFPAQTKRRSSIPVQYNLDEYWGLHETWSLRAADTCSVTQLSSAATRGFKFAQLSTKGSEPTGELCGDILREEEKCPLLQRCVFNPDSLKRWSWALAGVVVLGFDLVMIPLQAVGLVHALPKAVDVTTCVYWFLDLPIQMLTGIDEDGLIDMRPSSTIKNYVKTWMLPDLSFVLLDFCILVLDVEKTFKRAGESLRVVRLVRMLRLIRAHKLQRVKTMIEACIFSTHLILILKLFWLILCMITFNHCVACAWYACSSQNSREHTWLNTYVFDQDDAWHSYVSALHWSLCQFSPATNNIAPQNSGERVFAICVAVFGLVIFSSFISHVTNAVNQLKVLSMRRVRERHQMIDFLRRMKVSTELGRRISIFFDTSFGKQARPVQEKDVDFFSSLPQNLLIRLHKEINFSSLMLSVIYKLCNYESLELLVQMCHTSMSEAYYCARQDVFIDGTECSLMYYVQSGQLQYHPYFLVDRFSSPSGSSRIIPGIWLSEAALWLQWVHAGCLEATIPSCIVGLSSASVRSAVAKARGTLFEAMKFYAILFVSYYEELQEHRELLTDLPIPLSDSEKLVERALKLSQGLAGNKFKKDLSSKSPQEGKDSPDTFWNTVMSGFSRQSFQMIKRRSFPRSGGSSTAAENDMQSASANTAEASYSAGYFTITSSILSGWKKNSRLSSSV